MTTQRTMDVSELPPFEISSKAPLWLGQFLMCLIEGSMFCILIATYFYIRLSMDVFPRPGVSYPGPRLATIALVPLLVSCIGSYWASEAAKKGERRGMIIGLGLNLVLAIVFVVLRGLEWGTLNFNWKSDAHGSIVWSILFLHTYDMIADILMTAVLLFIVIIGKYREKQRLGVHVDSVIWYFLTIIWIPLYIVVYWGPRIVGGGQ